MHDGEGQVPVRKGYGGYRAPAAVLLLGFLAALLLVWTYLIVERQSKFFAWADAAMDIRANAALFHLWFEEEIYGYKEEDARKTFSYIDEALDLSEAMLSGGESEHGTSLPRLDEPRFQKHGEIIKSHLVKMKEIGLRRHRDLKNAGVGSPLDLELNAVFRDLDKEARILEVLAEQRWESDQIRTGRLHLVIMAAWILIIGASATGLFRRERRRGQAEAALERAYDEMEQKVTARTAELSAANRKLQEEIAERERAKLSLKRSEGEYRKLSTHFRTLLDTIPDSITLVSPDLKVIWANKGAAAACLPHLHGRYCHEIWHDRSTPCGDCPALKSFRSGRMESGRVTSPDGRHWDIRTVPVVKEGGAVEGVIEVASDVTETVNLQAEGLRAAHLASLGELAAGVAHEINNPVNGIISCAEILLNKTGEGTREHEASGRILKEGSRIAVIVKSLLSFGREEAEEKAPSHVQEILADSIALTGAQLKKDGISLVLDVPADLPPVPAQSQQLVQVFLNLINNARYALSQKYPGNHEEKVLAITAREVGADDRPRVRIGFRDRGTGIPENIVGRVVDPFFSTKPKGMGTGLGLSVSHGIILRHGGTLTIDSVEGAFTEVAIELPVSGKR